MAVTQGTGVKVVYGAGSLGQQPEEPALAMLWMLQARLIQRQEQIDLYEQYYDGVHKLQFATTKFREAFGNTFAAFSDNWCELVADASVERLAVMGMRFGKEAEEGDGKAWDIWQANQMDAQSIGAFTTSVVTGYSYLLVEPNEDEKKQPRMTVEHPCEVIVATAPGNRRKRIGALKRWQSDDGYYHAIVYTPERIYAYVSQKPVKSSTSSGNAGFWVEDSTIFKGKTSSVRNPIGVIPIIPMPNNPDARGFGRSDIDQVIPTQDAINKLVTDMLVASEFAAFPQRWATGIEVPRDEAGNPIGNDVKAAVSRLWLNEDENVKYGQFEAADLGNYVKGFEAMVQHIAARTRTPPHYLLGSSGTFPSGESLKATETGLVAKVMRKQVFLGEGLEDAFRLAFLIAGDKAKSVDMGCEVLWRDPESRTEGELVDALVKMSTLGVPRKVLWAKWGASPREIVRWEAMMAEQAVQDALAAQFAAPLEQTAPVGQPGGNNPADHEGPEPTDPNPAQSQRLS